MTQQYEQEDINLAVSDVTLAEVLVNGATTSGRSIIISSGDSITAPAGTGGADGSALPLVAGAGDAAGVGGALTAFAGPGGVTGAGGAASLAAGDGGATSGGGGDANVSGGVAVTGNGGDANVTGGAATTGDGGNVVLTGGAGSGTVGGVFIPVIKAGATQGASGALANELWKTDSHATLPDNVILIGV